MCAKRTLTGWVLGLFALALLLASGASAAQLRVTAVGARHEERAGTAKPAVRISATLQCPRGRRIGDDRWRRRWIPGHYEWRKCKVLVSRRGRRYRGRLSILPGFCIRIGRPGRYEIRWVRVWVPGHFGPPEARKRGRVLDDRRDRGGDHGRHRDRHERDDHGRGGGRGGRRS